MLFYFSCKVQRLHKSWNILLSTDLFICPSRISVHLNSSYTGSSVEEDQKNTENGTWNEYDRIAISDFIYAAKEVCGPIAYNGKGVTAAWLRIAKPAKMKKYPNHTMMGEL